jgi:hypothetical protein
MCKNIMKQLHKIAESDLREDKMASGKVALVQTVFLQ